MLMWVDMETTGLDEQARNAYPLEIAAVLTDDQLNAVSHWEGVIHFSTADIIYMAEQGHSIDPAVIQMHSENGLFALCESAFAWMNPFAVDDELETWVESLDLAEKPPLAGSTIGFDRAWMKRFFPKFHSKLHYRNIDVSTIKELTARWNPKIHRHYNDTKPTSKPHRAHDDIIESIRELLLYKELIFDEIEVQYMVDKLQRLKDVR